MKKWLADRKELIAVWMVVLLAVVLVFFGKLAPGAVLGVALFAFGLFAESYRVDLLRHQAETLQLLREVALAGQAATERNGPAAVQAGTQAIEAGAKLVEECEQEGNH